MITPLRWNIRLRIQLNVTNRPVCPRSLLIGQKTGSRGYIFVIISECEYIYTVQLVAYRVVPFGNVHDRLSIFDRFVSLRLLLQTNVKWCAFVSFSGTKKMTGISNIFRQGNVYIRKTIFWRRRKFNDRSSKTFATNESQTEWFTNRLRGKKSEENNSNISYSFSPSYHRFSDVWTKPRHLFAALRSVINHASRAHSWRAYLIAYV